MFKRILIANRGEIAVRIIRACREMGIESVAVYSEADKNSLHVKLADKSVCIGPAVSSLSYLNIPRILAAAEITKADAIHPGYGFLAENAKFAALCHKHDVCFIGPTPENMASLGDKVSARKLAQEANVPMFPGSLDAVKDEKELITLANEIGYPLIIKASAGGGGRGMKVVENEQQLRNSYKTASQEALACFGNGDIFVEKYCPSAKHVEIQIIADNYGNVVHLGERDCSLQRRHQKVLEESPCTTLDSKTREKMGQAAVSLAAQAGYQSAGTVEFLLDKDNNFYFMEMNTRIQVEHPVTEMVTGVDIVQEQIKVAAGEKLSLTQDQITFEGHCIECRILAEHSFNFRPSPGNISQYWQPGGMGIRLDTFIYSGYTVLPHYDSMIAKLLTHGKTRTEAISKMRSALSEFKITGIDTNIDFQKVILQDKTFLNGTYNTTYLNEFIKEYSPSLGYNSSREEKS